MILTMGILIALPFQCVLASSLTAGNVIDLVNADRSLQNVPPLALNDALNKAAQDKAQDMLGHGYFAHTSPQGVTPWFWFAKEGYDYMDAGENLAMNFDDAGKQNQAWMESPAHRKNIMNPKYQEAGVATAQGVLDGKKVSLTVLEFGHRDGVVLGLANNKTSTSASLAIAEKMKAYGSQAVGGLSSAVRGASSAMKTYAGNEQTRGLLERSALAGSGASLVLLMVALLGIFAQTHRFGRFTFGHQRHFFHRPVGVAAHLVHLENPPIDSALSAEKMYLMHMKLRK